MAESGVIACVSCGEERFGAGVIEASPLGGFDVLMPCKNCRTMNAVLHDDDPEMAQLLLSFFANQDPKLTIPYKEQPDD